MKPFEGAPQPSVISIHAFYQLLASAASAAAGAAEERAPPSRHI